LLDRRLGGGVHGASEAVQLFGERRASGGGGGRIAARRAGPARERRLRRCAGPAGRNAHREPLELLLDVVAEQVANVADGARVGRLQKKKKKLVSTLV
jgi:hypothetical protein